MTEMNRGAIELRRSLKNAARGKKKELAEKLGVSQSVLSHWMSARRRPMTRFRAEIQRLVGIDILAWDKEVGSRSTEAA